MIKMLKGQKKKKTHKQEQGKTIHEALRNVNYRATQNKKDIGATSLERSVVYTTGRGGGLKPFIVQTPSCVPKWVLIQKYISSVRIIAS